MAKKPIQKKSKKAAKKAGGRRKKGKRSYKSYISKVVKGLKGKFKMSKKAMAIVNSFAADLFDRGPKRHVPPWVTAALLRLFGSARCVSPPQDRRRGWPPGQAHRRQDAVLRGHAGGLPPPGELRAPAAAAPQCCQAAFPPTAPRPEDPSCPASWRSTP